jgi:hypothetical protein
MNQFLKIQNKGGMYLPTNPFPVLSIWEKNSLYSFSCQIGFITPNRKHYKPNCKELIMLLERITTMKTKNKKFSGKLVYINEIFFYLARFYSSFSEKHKTSFSENISLLRRSVSVHIYKVSMGLTCLP